MKTDPMRDLPERPKVIGLKQTLKYLGFGQCEEVLIAEDCDDAIADSVKRACDNAQVPYTVRGRKKALGDACHIERAAAVIGFLKQTE